MEFIGRKKELKALENAYRSQGSAFMPVYGRRRVGKSELIKHFIKDKQALYFLGKQAPGKLQLREFLRNGASVLKQPLLEQASAADWQEAISMVLEQVPAGETIPHDIIIRPGIALSMLTGFVCGIVAFFVGLIGITRKKDYSVLVFLSTAFGFLTLLWCLTEILFPH